MHHQSTSGGVDAGAEEAGYIFSSAMPETAQLLSTVFNIIIIVLGWWSILLEVFLRYDFGERYLSWLRLFFAYSLLSWLVFFPAVFNSALAIQGAPFFKVFSVAFILFSLNHRLRIWLRYQHGIPWHSMSFGTSWLAALNLPVIGKDDWTLYRWYEPALCLLISFVIGRFDGTTGFVIGAGSLVLLLKNHMIYYQQRGRILDLIDARLESIYYNDAAYGKPKEAVAGISVMKVVWPKLPPAPAGLDAIAETVNTALGGNTPSSPQPSGPSAGSVDFAATIAETLKSDNDS